MQRFDINAPVPAGISLNADAVISGALIEGAGGLADLFFRRAITATDLKETNELSLRAEGFARKALELDPQLSEAHTAMGRAHRALRYDYATAEFSFRRAIELDPNNVQAHGFLGQLYLLRGDHDAALKMADRVAEIDPRAHAVIFLRYRANEAKRDFEQGLKHAEEAFALDKQVHYARIALASFLFYNGQFERMEAVVREGFDDSPGFAFIWHQLLARAALRNGDMRAAAEHIGKLEHGAADSTKYLYRLAVIYAEQGRHEEAFDALERCIDNGEAWAAWMNSEPGFDSIRPDPRFSGLLARMNLSQ
ncbi:MAG: tetratricopeptide repeat protein [Blastocatellia bacterium]|nr:tetratricopeptide repeat protein [Blastocatellia bacterium]